MMSFVVVAFGLAAAVWGAIFVRRMPLSVGVALLLVVGYVFGHEFWNVRVGPLPITLDRLLLGGLLAALAVQWRCGDLRLRPLTGSDVAVIALLLVFALSAATSGEAVGESGSASKWGRFMASFLLPAAGYALVRQLPLDDRQWRFQLIGLAVLGVYLALTAICEAAGEWQWVFPRYLADPQRGIHFGRARGPELNSVSLGMVLTVCAASAWLLRAQIRQRPYRLGLWIAVALMVVGVWFTYTRSTYIGLAAAVAVIALLAVPRGRRIPLACCGAMMGVLMLMVVWGQLVGIEREGEAGDSQHSVSQRSSFAYVSWKMFCDHPVLGVGFGRFFDAKLPYLSDRRQQVELESIRGLHHHNTVLSVLTETGLVGLTAFVAVFVAWGRAAWMLATRLSAPWMAAQGILMLVVLANYACSAVFHDLTLLPTQEFLLFLMAGLTINLYQVAFGRGLSVAGARLIYSSACPVRIS